MHKFKFAINFMVRRRRLLGHSRHANEWVAEPGEMAMAIPLPNGRLNPSSRRFIRKLFIILWERAFLCAPQQREQRMVYGREGNLWVPLNHHPFPGVGKSFAPQLQTACDDYDSDLCRSLLRYERASFWGKKSGRKSWSVPGNNMPDHHELMYDPHLWSLETCATPLK